MLRASRRGDRKRVPQYSSSLLRGGRTGIFREASAGCRPGARWASRPRSAVPEGPALPGRKVPKRDIHVSESVTRPTAWVGGERNGQGPPGPERYERQDY